ncbi:MAG: histidine phosphatase family protein [Nostocoides sp.]
MPTPVYLVRHGESEWNLLRRTQGQIAHPRLTERGRTQAAAAADLIAADMAERDRVVLSIVTSDLTRAAQTAAILADRLRARLAYDTRLREQALGELEGKSYEETWAAADAHDWSDPSLPVAGGESPMDVYERVGALLDEVIGADTAGAIVLVSHGDAIRMALAHLAGVAPHQAPWVAVDNGAVARLGDQVTWIGQ